MPRPSPALVVAGLGASALVLALCWGLLTGSPGLTGGFLGEAGVDQWGTQWFYWYVGRQLAAGEGLVHTDLFFHPWGKDIYAHTGANVLDAALAAPLRALLGVEAGYNVFVLLGLAFNAWAFHRFARRFTDDRAALVVGTLWLAASPYVLVETLEGRPTQAILGLIPLFLLALWDLGTRPGLRAPLVAGVLLALTGLVYWFYALFAGLAAVAHGLVRFAAPPPGAGSRWRVLGRHALAAATSLALVAPFALPLALATVAHGEDVPGLLLVDDWTHVSIPPVTQEGVWVGLYTWQPLVGQAGLYLVEGGLDQVFKPQHALTGLLEWLALAALLLTRPRLRVPVGAMVLTGALLALGPLVVVGNDWYPNPLYIALAQTLDPLRRLWWPARALAVVVPLLALAMALAVARLRARPWLQAAAVAALAGALAWRHHEAGRLPFPLWSSRVPDGYLCLAEGPPGAIIELPFSWEQSHVYYQTAHGRPLLGGMIEDNPVFTPPEALALRRDNSWLRALLAYDPEDDVVERWTEADRDAMHALGFRYVVLRKLAYGLDPDATGMIARARATHLRRHLQGVQALLGPPIYQDETINLYAPWGDPRPCR